MKNKGTGTVSMRASTNTPAYTSRDLRAYENRKRRRGLSSVEEEDRIAREEEVKRMILKRRRREFMRKMREND